MIGLVKLCSGVGNLCRYVMGEGKGYELDRGMLCGKNTDEIIQEFELLQDQNRNAVKKTISMVLSPHPSDGAALTDAFMREISKSFMEKLGIDPSAAQYASWVHTNSNYRHIHLIVSRVRLDSTLIDARFIALRCMNAADEVAIERGLVSTKSLRAQSREQHSPMLGEHWRIKKDIAMASKKILLQGVSSLEDFAGKMRLHGFEVSFVENKKGELQGYRIFHQSAQISFKASELNRDLQLKALISSGIFPEKKRKLNPVLQKSFACALGNHILKGIKKIERETQNDREHDR